jgi:hypothetical protein
MRVEPGSLITPCRVPRRRRPAADASGGILGGVGPTLAADGAAAAFPDAGTPAGFIWRMGVAGSVLFHRTTAHHGCRPARAQRRCRGMLSAARQLVRRPALRASRSCTRATARRSDWRRLAAALKQTQQRSACRWPAPSEDFMSASIPVAPAPLLAFTESAVVRAHGEMPEQPRPGAGSWPTAKTPGYNRASSSATGGDRRVPAPQWSCELPSHQGDLGARRKPHGSVTYEWHDDVGHWFRSYGNENWEFDAAGSQARHASINDRRSGGRAQTRSAAGLRPQDHPGRGRD